MPFAKAFGFKPIGTWKDWISLLRIDRPVGYWLLMWPTLWGLLASSHGRPQWKHLFIFTLGVFVMRSAGCIVNDLADRRYDRHVARTKHRPLAAGRISPGAAFLAFCFLMIVAFFLVLQTSPYVVKLAFVGAGLAAIYPLMKRITFFPQAWLGVAFGWGGIMAWAAEAGSPLNSTIPWTLLLANVFWTLAYDTAYAVADRSDDLRIGVKSTAIRFGERVLTAIHVFAWIYVLLLALAAWQIGGGAWLGWVAAATWQGRLSWVLMHEGEGWAFQYFLNAHWSGAFFCIGLLI